MVHNDAKHVCKGVCSTTRSRYSIQALEHVITFAHDDSSCNRKISHILCDN